MAFSRMLARLMSRPLAITLIVTPAFKMSSTSTGSTARGKLRLNRSRSSTSRAMGPGPKRPDLRSARNRPRAASRLLPSNAERPASL